MISAVETRRRRLQRRSVMAVAMVVAAAAVAIVERIRRFIFFLIRPYQSGYQYRRRLFALRRWDDAKFRILCRFIRAGIRQFFPFFLSGRNPVDGS
jgi:hypothetical protein